MKLRKWVIVLLSIILIASIVILAMDFTDFKLFVISKAISVVVIILISKIFTKYSILEA